MASLTDTQISSTYTGLLKTADNGDLSGNTGSSTVNISDGIGTATKLNLSTTRIGIGTTSPDNLLHVVDGSGAPVRFGDDAINRSFSYKEVLYKLKEFSSNALIVEEMKESK